jgi:hypothetical protein
MDEEEFNALPESKRRSFKKCAVCGYYYQPRSPYELAYHRLVGHERVIRPLSALQRTSKRFRR